MLNIIPEIEFGFIILLAQTKWGAPDGKISLILTLAVGEAIASKSMLNTNCGEPVIGIPTED